MYHLSCHFSFTTQFINTHHPLSPAQSYEKVWKKVAAAERGKLIFKLADLIERDAAELATLEALDNGKAYKIALEGDIADSVGCYRYFAGWADKIHGKTIETTYDKLCYTRHEPVGVVGAIIVSIY